MGSLEHTGELHHILNACGERKLTGDALRLRLLHERCHEVAAVPLARREAGHELPAAKRLRSSVVRGSHMFAVDMMHMLAVVVSCMSLFCYCVVYGR